MVSGRRQGAVLCWGVLPALQGVADATMHACKQESPLSGTLNLGHYGISQSTGFEAVTADANGAQIVTPFAKLQLPYKARFARASCLELARRFGKALQREHLARVMTMAISAPPNLTVMCCRCAGLHISQH